ncbi:MAG: preprotein translocase subunit SecE [Alphaproteobacteria bacterium GM7ARS4]|nr:preprotein translocase subunit SecE [Alphaproteobacteria bacterium GM7ARS4]
MAFNPIRFLDEVKREVVKVAWPTKQETLMTTLIVFIFVGIAAVFFLIVDQIVAWGIQTILGVG